MTAFEVLLLNFKTDSKTLKTYSVLISFSFDKLIPVTVLHRFIKETS